MRWLRVILVLGAFVHLSGGHYGVLQGIAWTKMLIDYSARDGLVEGARKTFDGQHPCRMCESIASAKQEENERRSEAPARGLENLSLKDLRIPESISLGRPSSSEHAGHDFARLTVSEGLPGTPPPVRPPRGV